MATATLWRTFHHDGNISQGWCGWGLHARPPPFSISTITNKIVVYAPAEDRYTPLFLLYPYMYSVGILRLKYAWMRNFPKLVEKTITLLTHYLVEVSQNFSRYPILSLKSMVLQ
jgi:hypothetical protein